MVLLNGKAQTGNKAQNSPMPIFTDEDRLKAALQNIQRNSGLLFLLSAFFPITNFNTAM